MDLFGKQRIAELEKANANLQRRCADHEETNLKNLRDMTALRNQIDYLIRTIRDMDDKLFSISQCSDWPQMRPRINALVDEMIARKVIESKRIESLMKREFHSTYKSESQVLKQITKGKS